MRTFAYDVEVFPNLFTATFLNVENEEEYTFYIGLDKTDIFDLVSFLQEEMVLVGYNSISYDDPVLRFILGYQGDNLNKDIYKLSQKLVDDNYRGEKDILKLRYPRDIKYSWSTIDLMAILAFDKLGISLKQTAINLKWRRIQDLPLPYWHEVKQEELATILDYNMNDVQITKKLYEAVEPLRKLRDELSNLYGINLRSASDSKIANLILENIYSKELRVNIRSIKDLRTIRASVSLGECIAPFVKFKTEELQSLQHEIASTTVYRYNNYMYFKKISYAGCDFNFGTGGLHTEDLAGKFESDDEYLIQDMDVASYYPNLIINNGFYPQHLGPDFIKVLKKITKERIAAKHAGDKVKADGLKITVNSIFGKLGAEHYWLLDIKQMFSTTVSGQLGLMMLVEDLTINGIEVISANTDGIVCRIDRSLLDKYYEIANEWMKNTGLDLEYTPYKKYIRRDVNNYITEKEDGKTKEKGIFTKSVLLNKSYRMPIVATALYQYFINGVPVRTTLESTKDIMEFCISQKMGGGFSAELRTINGTEKLQKTNRFFISNKGGTLIKVDGSGKEIALYVNKTSTVLNDYDETIPFENYDVDFSFYEKEINKIIDDIEPKQFSLFDISKMSKGNRTKMLMPPNPKRVEERNIYSVNELNKLGKNQLAKELENIYNEKRKIENINPRYTYVVEIKKSSLKMTLYSFAKGTTQIIKVDRKAMMASDELNVGSLVFCNKFDKRNEEFILSEFRVTDKFDISGISII